MVANSKVMDVKKTQNQSASKDEALIKKVKARDFVEEIKSEFRHITWTSKEELKAYTQIVVGATFVFGLGVYLVDLTIQSVLNVLTLLTRWIGG